MSYIYFFLIIFIPLYALLVEKDDFLKLNIKIIIAGLVSVSSLLVYENILSDGSLELAHQKQSLDIFLREDQQDKENKREEVKNLITQLIKKRDVEPGELYILARQLKNIDEFMLSRDLYMEIYNRFGNDLDGEVVAEYAQVLFMSSGREFSDTIYILLEEALILAQIIFITIILTADNAIIIGVISANFVPKNKKQIILWGVSGALIFKIIFALFATYLFKFYFI